MVSNDPKPSKRRTGRHRLPPLAQGPALQFIVATHPDDFRATTVLRNVRSHVMYKHQETRTSSPATLARSREGSNGPSALTRTPSPVTTDSFGILPTTAPVAPAYSRGYESALSLHAFDAYSPSSPTDSLRSLAARILSMASPTSPHSAPAACEEGSGYPFPRSNTFQNESLGDLKREWIRNTVLFCHDQAWMRYVCDSHLSFLSHVYATLVYHDIDEGLLYDSRLTVFAKTKILRLISSRLDTDNATIICILHLIISEIGSDNEGVFSVHRDGLATCLRSHRDGLNSGVARFMTLIMLTFTIARNQPESAEFTPWFPSKILSDNGALISPLSPPITHASHLYRVCSVGAAGIIMEIQNFTDIGQLANCDSQLQSIYSRLLLLPSTESDITPDWIYESCRIAALIYCRSMVHGISLADSASVVHPATARSDTKSATLLLALHETLERTNKQSCWGHDLAGVFLWVTLIGASASWASPRLESKDDVQTATWVAKCFSLHAVRAAVSVSSDHIDATIHALRVFLKVQHWVAVKAGSLGLA
ncbi:hypothetical protein COCC4DRAFT_134879 [Bipolaris maydis ATCC 48331]|uniref:Transcription factor domain-containing protein n=2 Tax=Cochliobolus heterostrophus TaxID=5016 RepID=M2TXJ1_COCH5|nr:uncharacterized protein COCC4DRAFT_134879 [Bipolaris maydis ATCC 48331]EMD86416.1 hypothetical protein COCHEDRAFT_1116596 [Bipolaris maydis C5]KAJ5064929.1 hypothetical protein J3E74DRAFT_423944 [Bipolaris maydis]ENI06367.1 hypothetical protein COCC4DRAFT_134879 [Bipolaris maydis ATCC 48331]KAJ6214033.1 hypothetical protein PSV09DRAFT_1116596 [Bipolaris maydis]KAJ6275234.1 hypothetical protein PSV08DRAFT_170764 [Bipolaris maydis]